MNPNVTPECRAPIWCGTTCTGTKGPGLNARKDVDYVRGWATELFCSIKCRDHTHPQLKNFVDVVHKDGSSQWVAVDVLRALALKAEFEKWATRLNTDPKMRLELSIHQGLIATLYGAMDRAAKEAP